MTERLHFNAGMAYESMVAAEHLVRYWLLREVCRGKRVLDVACGEGYGSSLLRKWGAKEVVGVDVSRDAIENARKRFAAPGISYLVGDACDLDTVLTGAESFDLIASFETMEHVPDVPGLLRGIRKRLAPGGTIAISCPNDPEIAADHPNEFHLRTYTFQEFQVTTTEILGPATQWQLGTPVLGFGICNTTDAWMQGLGTSLSHMLDGADSTPARFLPAQASHEVSVQTAHFYVGVWGAPLPRIMVAAPIAYRAYVGPWNSWVAAREENDQLIAAQAAAAQRHDQMHRKVQMLEGELVAYNRQITTERSDRLRMAARFDENQRAYRSVEAERDALNAQLHMLRSSRAHRVTQRYYYLYEYRATRWFMRPLRDIAARFVRLLKG